MIIKMANAWITYVKEWASKHGKTYTEALKDPKLKEDYAKSKPKDAKPMKAKKEAVKAK